MSLESSSKYNPGTTDSDNENESEQVIYFTWKKVDKGVTKAQQMVNNQIKVKSKFQRNSYLLKGFKRMLIINIKLNYPMVIC